MRKLLSANNRYLFKNKLYWLELLFCVVFSVWIAFANYSDKIQASANPLHLENVFFNFYQMLCIAFAAVISLIVGTEYSDGTIRNKVIVGHTRAEIYFSMLITNIEASVIAIAVHGVVTYGIGYFLFGGFTIPMGQIIAYILCSLLANLVFTAVFVAIAMNCSNKSVTAVVSMIIAVVVIFAANIAGGRLIEPEMTYDGVTISVDGIEYGDLIKNPNYVSGFKRSVWEFIYDFLPSGQLIQIQQLELDNLIYSALLSVLFFASVTIVGYILFRKKDIK